MPQRQLFPVQPGDKTVHHAQTIARNVKRLRARFGITQLELAERDDIDPSMLCQIEAGKGHPSLGLAWRFAHALQVPLTELIAEQAPRGAVVVRYDKAPHFVSGSRGLSSRALLPFDEARNFELFELTLAPNWQEAYDAHHADTQESVHAARGSVEIGVGRETLYSLGRGDTATFPADLPHSYRNLTDEPALLYLIMAYSTSRGGDSNGTI